MAPANYIIFVLKWTGIHLPETLKSIGNQPVEVFDNKEHDWSVAKCWNLAIQKHCIDGEYDSVIICNDDVILRPNTAEMLHRTLNYKWGFPMAAPLITTAYDTREMPDRGPGWMPDRFNMPAGYFCFCANEKLVDTVGWFDDEFYPAYFEDTDMTYRIKLEGYEVYSVMPAYHYSGTTHQNDSDRAALVRNSKPGLMEYYQKKWGGMPWKETYLKPFDPTAVTNPRRERESIADHGYITEFPEL